MGISSYSTPTIWADAADAQPEACCHACGIRWGRWYYTGTYLGPTPPPNAITRTGTCEVCDTPDTVVASPRVYGEFIRGWQQSLRFARYRA